MFAKLQRSLCAVILGLALVGCFSSTARAGLVIVTIDKNPPGLPPAGIGYTYIYMQIATKTVTHSALQDYMGRDGRVHQRVVIWNTYEPVYKWVLVRESTLK